jgi:acetyl-CoA acetyltransferase
MRVATKRAGFKPVERKLMDFIEATQSICEQLVSAKSLVEEYMGNTSGSPDHGHALEIAGKHLGKALKAADLAKIALYSAAGIQAEGAEISEQLPLASAGGDE